GFAKPYIRQGAYNFMGNIAYVRVRVNGIHKLDFRIADRKRMDCPTYIPKGSTKILTAVYCYQDQPLIWLNLKWQAGFLCSDAEQGIDHGVSGHEYVAGWHSFSQQIFPGAFRRGEVPFC